MPMVNERQANKNINYIPTKTTLLRAQMTTNVQPQNIF